MHSNGAWSAFGYDKAVGWQPLRKVSFLLHAGDACMVLGVRKLVIFGYNES